MREPEPLDDGDVAAEQRAVRLVLPLHVRALDAQVVGAHAAHAARTNELCACSQPVRIPAAATVVNDAQIGKLLSTVRTTTCSRYRDVL